MASPTFNFSPPKNMLLNAFLLCFKLVFTSFLGYDIQTFCTILVQGIKARMSHPWACWATKPGPLSWAGGWRRGGTAATGCTPADWRVLVPSVYTCRLRSSSPTPSRAWDSRGQRPSPPRRCPWRYQDCCLVTGARRCWLWVRWEFVLFL